MQSFTAVLLWLSVSHSVFSLPCGIFFVQPFSLNYSPSICFHLHRVYTPNGSTADLPVIQVDGLLLDEVADCSVFPGERASGCVSWLSE